MRGGDEAVVLHTLDDVELARAGTFGVVDGVIGRRRFGQASQHGGFGNAQILNRFAKVGFGCCRKTICAVAQENLVQVDFKNLVFAQQMLELVGQQQFVNFAGEGFLRRQVDIARHLHGDGGGSLAFGATHVGQTGTRQTDVVHPAMLVKTCVFDRQHGLLDHIGDVFEGHQFASLFAKLANDFAFNGKNPHGQLGSVVGQIGDVRQLGIGHGQRDTYEQNQAQESRHTQPCSPNEEAPQYLPQAGLGGLDRFGARAFGRLGRRGHGGGLPLEGVQVCECIVKTSPVQLNPRP